MFKAEFDGKVWPTDTDVPYLSLKWNGTFGRKCGYQKNKAQRTLCTISLKSPLLLDWPEKRLAEKSKMSA